MRGLGLAVSCVVVSLVAGCGGGGRTCETGQRADGSWRIALDGICLEDVRAESYEGGWVDADLSLAEVDGGVLVTMTAPGASTGLRLRLPGLSATTMHQQGYQSWGFAGTVEIPRVIDVADDGAPSMPAAASGDPIDETIGVSSVDTIMP